MDITKNQLEAVRYQLKKIGQSASNDEIREAARSLESFDAVKVAELVLTSRNTQLSTSQAGLTISQKQELVKIQAGFMGIELSQVEIQNIASSADNQITDNIDFLLEVQGLIKEFLSKRNQQFQHQTAQIVDGIAAIINDGEQELAQIVTNTNERLRDIVGQCQAVKTDYKSPYKSRIQSMRESLGLSAQ